MADLGKMSKKQLESYARKEHGVELDRRHSKKQLLARMRGLVEEEVEVLTPPAPKLEVPKESTIIKHLERLHELRTDAAVIWKEIQDKDLTDEDLRELIRSHNFGTLLGKVSQ
jgi:hypothetical protein